MHQSLQGATFHIEHVIPRVRGGTDELDNLALCVSKLQSHKSDRVTYPLVQTRSRCLVQPKKRRVERSFRVGRLPTGWQIRCWEADHPIV